ncbi:SpoVG family protein [Rhodopirellula halodulae]|uniref:SpoVG family protein n=1 Tax=Rhodopirellula halodulae TaxID=2894198 RepID=UPI001E4A0CE0|nr:SpoVG family protein [Rhodopirellula sp. JC737]MCC9654476.1 SpoVG family protein [Rhodopirellula sp. JC737]
MEITEIRIKLMESSEDRLRAFCSITIDQSFVVRDLKIIDGASGPFVAMPSRKLTGHCNRCSSKNHLRATYCNHCGAKLSGHSVNSPQKLYADVAHPINSECREMIQQAVIEEFEAELTRSSQPGYRSRYEDDFDAGDYDEADYADTASSSSSNSGNSPAANGDSETLIVRGEGGDDQRIPQPHMHRRGGGSRGSTVTNSPNRDAGGAQPSDSSQAESDGAEGFGAGIFDE